MSPFSGAHRMILTLLLVELAENIFLMEAHKEHFSYGAHKELLPYGSSEGTSYGAHKEHFPMELTENIFLMELIGTIIKIYLNRASTL